MPLFVCSNKSGRSVDNYVIGNGASVISWSDTEIIGTIPGLSGKTVDRIILNSLDNNWQLNQTGFGVAFP